MCERTPSLSANFQRVVDDNREKIISAKSLGAAAGIVFQAVRGEGRNAGCGGGLVGIAEKLVELTLRSPDELQPFKNRMNSGCAGNTCPALSVVQRFDVSAPR